MQEIHNKRYKSQNLFPREILLEIFKNLFIYSDFDMILEYRLIHSMASLAFREVNICSFLSSKRNKYNGLHKMSGSWKKECLRRKISSFFILNHNKVLNFISFTDFYREFVSETNFVSIMDFPMIGGNILDKFISISKDFIDSVYSNAENVSPHPLLSDKETICYFQKTFDGLTPPSSLKEINKSNLSYTYFLSEIIGVLCRKIRRNREDITYIDHFSPLLKHFILKEAETRTYKANHRFNYGEKGDMFCITLFIDQLIERCILIDETILDSCSSFPKDIFIDFLWRILSKEDKIGYFDLFTTVMIDMYRSRTLIYFLNKFKHKEYFPHFQLRVHEKIMRKILAFESHKTYPLSKSANITLKHLKTMIDLLNIKELDYSKNYMLIGFEHFELRPDFRLSLEKSRPSELQNYTFDFFQYPLDNQGTRIFSIYLSTSEQRYKDFISLHKVTNL